MLPTKGYEPTPSDSEDLSQTLHYNPFAGHSGSSFSSAVRLSEGRAAARPTYRRRRSELNITGKKERHAALHEDEEHSDVQMHVRSVSAHPLDPSVVASTSSSRQNSLNGTRSTSNNIFGLEPSRRTSSSSLVQSGRSSAIPERGGEKIVIVHEVAPKDSLVGVALKYGISLPELRRANQMWVSDPIHLRKTLYIPLEKSQRAKEIMLMMSETEEQSTFSNTEPHNSKFVERRFPEHNILIRRIPASRLSFFPTSTDPYLESRSSFPTFPRSNRSRRPSNNTVVSDLPTSKSSAPSVHASHPTHIPPEGSRSSRLPLRAHLTSLFNTLPIAPSTRDALISRLSLDSGASTPSQHSEEQDHELEEVSDMLWPSSSSPYLRKPRSGHGDFTISPPSVVEQDVELQPFNSSALPAGSADGRQPVSSSQRGANFIEGAGYLSPDLRHVGGDRVRTAQLEPSAGMQLPLKGRNKPTVP